MTFEEAKEQARKGIKVTHQYFTPDEYMTMKGNQIMFEIVEFNKDFLAVLSDESRRDQLHYHEYKFLETHQLKEYFINKYRTTKVFKDQFSLVALKGSKFLGFISAAKDEFDSENFGLACFRISNLLIFSREQREDRSKAVSQRENLPKAVSQRENLQIRIDKELNEQFPLSDQFDINNSFSPLSDNIPKHRDVTQKLKPLCIKTHDRDFFINRKPNPLLLQEPLMENQKLNTVIINENTLTNVEPIMYVIVINTIYELILQKTVKNFLFYDALLTDDKVENDNRTITLLNSLKEIVDVPDDMIFTNTDADTNKGKTYAVLYGNDVEMNINNIGKIKSDKKKKDSPGSRSSEPTRTTIEYNNERSNDQTLSTYEFLLLQKELTIEYKKSNRNVMKVTVDILDLSDNTIFVERVDGLTNANIIAITYKELSFTTDSEDKDTKNFYVNGAEAIYYHFV